MGKSDTTNISADIIVTDEQGRILLQLRDKEGEHSFPDCWALPGGSVEEGEAPEEGIRREFFEETGCMCNPKLAFIIKYETEDGREIDKYVFHAEYTGCEIQCLEGQKFEFKTLEELKNIENKNPQSEVLVEKFFAQKNISDTLK